MVQNFEQLPVAEDSEMCTFCSHDSWDLFRSYADGEKLSFAGIIANVCTREEETKLTFRGGGAETLRKFINENAPRGPT